MSNLSKLGIVLGGYAAALIAALATTYLWTWLNPSPASQGMQAFGDSLLFFTVFGLMSLLPTGLGLYFLRPFGGFWTVFSLASLVFAATGPFAAIKPVGFLSVARAMAAPLFGLGFLICGVIAPAWRTRWILFASAATEFAVGAYAFFCVLVFGRWLI